MAASRLVTGSGLVGRQGTATKGVRQRELHKCQVEVQKSCELAVDRRPKAMQHEAVRGPRKVCG